MMSFKNTILLTIAMITGASTAWARVDAPVLDQFINFISLEQAHKQEWFDFIKKSSDEKMDLVAKQHNRKYELAKQKFNTIKNLPSLSERSLQDGLMTQLNNALAEAKNRGEEWRALCKDQEDRGRQLADKQRDELEAFKSRLGQ